MKTIIAMCLALLPLSALAEGLSANDPVYKCVKDGKTTYQAMPCGWNSQGSDERRDAQQVIIPFSEFCSDKRISDRYELKQECRHFILPKDRH